VKKFAMSNHHVALSAEGIAAKIIDGVKDSSGITVWDNVTAKQWIANILRECERPSPLDGFTYEGLLFLSERLDCSEPWLGFGFASVMHEEIESALQRKREGMTCQ